MEEDRNKESSAPSVESGSLAQDPGLSICSASDQLLDHGTDPATIPSMPSSAAVDEITQVLQKEIEMRKAMESQLLIAMEAAEAANTAKSEFLANISHEFRTPLTLIISSSQLLSEYVIDSHQQEILNILQSASASLMELVSNLLDFSESEMGKMSINEHPLQLGDLMDEIAARFEPAANDKGICFSYRVHLSHEQTLIADPVRLQQILANLLDNAFKFTPEGDITCVLKSANPSDFNLAKKSHHHSIHIMVTDTGVGISPDKHKIIFDAFTQADGSLTRKYNGSGLGLALVRQLVEMMNGKIWVESEAGSGSTFHCIVQLRIADRMDSQTPVIEDSTLYS